jgi:hypothetical protein
VLAIRNPSGKLYIFSIRCSHSSIEGSSQILKQRKLIKQRFKLKYMKPRKQREIVEQKDMCPLLDGETVLSVNLI